MAPFRRAPRAQNRPKPCWNRAVALLCTAMNKAAPLLAGVLLLGAGVAGLTVVNVSVVPRLTRPAAAPQPSALHPEKAPAPSASAPAPAEASSPPAATGTGEIVADAATDETVADAEVVADAAPADDAAVTADASTAESSATSRAADGTVLPSVVFEPNSASASLNLMSVVDTIARYMRAHFDQKVILIGHGDDPTKGPEYMRLGRMRAQAVMRMLIDYGLSASRIGIEPAPTNDAGLPTSQVPPGTVEVRIEPRFAQKGQQP